VRNFKIGHVTLTNDHAHLRDSWSSGRLILLVAKPCTKFEVCSFSRSEDISWRAKF